MIRRKNADLCSRVYEKLQVIGVVKNEEEAALLDARYRAPPLLRIETETRH